MNRPGRAAVAFANSSCMASVVFPDPGPPAIRLNESAGSPPPSTSSSPGTAVGNRSRATLTGVSGLADRFLAIAPSLRGFARGLAPTGPLHQLNRHILSYHPCQQRDKGGDDRKQAVSHHRGAVRPDERRGLTRRAVVPGQLLDDRVRPALLLDRAAEQGAIALIADPPAKPVAERATNPVDRFRGVLRRTRVRAIP